LQYWKLAWPFAGADGEPCLDLVFPTFTGKPQNPERAKLRPMKFHWLRHRLACDRGRRESEAVSTLMGHSSINVTVDIYGHMLQGTDRDAIERLERAI
jgi:integrase